MTPRKVSVFVGRRPDVEECLAGWYRVNGPARSRDAFDVYCAQLVERAFRQARAEYCRDSLAMEALLLHKCSTGRLSGFKVGGVFACPNGHDEMWLFCIVGFAYRELITQVKLAIWQAMPFRSGEEVLGVGC